MSKSSLFLVLAFLLTACKREINIVEPSTQPDVVVPIGEGQVGGKIILPANSKIDTAGLEVLSGLDLSVPQKLNYAIDTTGKISTTLVMNKAGDVVLMGYNYPSQANGNITVESTAIALIMNTMSAMSLTADGRVELVKKLLASGSLPSLTGEISKALASGKSFTEGDGEAISAAIISVFKEANQLRTTQTQSRQDPVTIKVVNNTILLESKDVSHTQVAGVYHKGKLLDYKFLEGRTRWATDLADALIGRFGSGYGGTEPQIFDMHLAGEYQIKVRSGRPFRNDGTEEYRLALYQNALHLFLTMLFDAMPYPGDCRIALINSVRNVFKIVDEEKFKELANAETAEQFGSAGFKITSTILNDMSTVGVECIGAIGQKYMRGLSRVMNVLTIPSQVMGALNLSSLTYDMFNALPAVDTCFSVIGQNTYPCGEDPTLKMVIVNGPGQIAAEQKTLAEPLRVRVTDPDGKPVSGIDVTWLVLKGAGHLDHYKSKTNSQGQAQAIWTLGIGDEQIVQAAVKNKDGKDISNSPAKFSAQVTGIPYNLEVVSGNMQRGEYKKALQKPLVIRITDIKGTPVKNVPVNWSVEFGGGEIFYSDKVTNDQGTANANWVLGPSNPQQNVQVSATRKDGRPLKNSPFLFSALTTAPVPYKIEMISGNNQEGLLKEELHNPLVVKVTDKDQKPLDNIPVKWEGYSFKAGSPKTFTSQTNTSGITETVWTLGEETGNYNVSAVLKNADGKHVNGSPLVFSIKANAPKTECELNKYTAPQILSTKREADAQGMRVLINFTADGPGILTNAGSGACDMEKLCYPVRLYFLNPGGEWGIAANGYSVKLVSGTVNAGVIEIRLAYGYCSLPSADECWEAVYPGYKWKVQLMNKCNQRSPETSI